MQENLRIVLVGTQHPGNIGAAARAMKTMGLGALALVAPEREPDAESVAMAAGADDLIAGAGRFDALPAAIADCALVLGCTARRRSVSLPEHEPRSAAQALVAAAARGPVALLFGRERTGLSNDELQCCHAAVHIPADPAFSSLNVASAVQVMAYELRRAVLGLDAGMVAAPAQAPVAPDHPDDAPASSAELEAFFAHLDQTLFTIDFHKGRAAETVMRRLRRLYLRADLSRREVRILRGILAESERMARLAGRAGAAP